MKYNVHIYPIVRVKVCDIEADSQKEAIKLAETQVNLYRLFDADGPEVEYAEGIDGFLVDEVGDSDFRRSTWYNNNGERREPV